MARKRQRKDSEVGVCRHPGCDRIGFAFDIVIPGDGRARVFLCQEKHDTQLLKIMGWGDWHQFGQKTGHRKIHTEDLGELLSHRGLPQ